MLFSGQKVISKRLIVLKYPDIWKYAFIGNTTNFLVGNGKLEEKGNC